MPQWIIQLRPPRSGARYLTLRQECEHSLLAFYTARGRNVTVDRDKAKRFDTKEEAGLKMAEGTAWLDRKVMLISIMMRCLLDSTQLNQHRIVGCREL